jgi:predicted esterase
MDSGCEDGVVRKGCSLGKGCRVPCRLIRGLLYLALLVLSLVACTGSKEPGLRDLMAAYYEASTSAELDAAIERILQSGASPAEVATMLREGKTYSPTVPKGWMVFTFEGLDGLERPYHVYVPTSYDPQTSHPLLFDLHGAVSYPAQPAEYLEQRRRLWEPEAEENGWILIVPHGDVDATWYSANGHANILGELDAVKRAYNVDENKVFVCGFSDGGSGAFWQGFHCPTPWAGLISFHGHPGVAGNGPYQAYPRNLLNRPIRATTGAQDELYPPGGIVPFIALFKAVGADIEWIVYPGGHETGFLDTEAPLTVGFIASTERNPLRSEIVWETSSTATGRCDWVRIDEMADVGNNAAFTDVNLTQASAPIVFGASVAYQGGTMFTVAGLEPGSTAHVMGVKTGDQLLSIGGYPVQAQADIADAMIGKRAGDVLEVVLVRGGETIVLSGRVQAADVFYARDLPTASIYAAAAGNAIDVSVNHVGGYTLFISSRQFDLSQPILVRTNGQTSFSDTVTPDIRLMLERAAEDFDREMIFEAEIRIRVPAASQDSGT